MSFSTAYCASGAPDSLVDEELEEMLRHYDDGAVIITCNATYSGKTEIRAFLDELIAAGSPTWKFTLSEHACIEDDEIYYSNSVWEDRDASLLSSHTMVVRTGRVLVHTYMVFGESDTELGCAFLRPAQLPSEFR